MKAKFNFKKIVSGQIYQRKNDRRESDPFRDWVVLFSAELVLLVVVGVAGFQIYQNWGTKDLSKELMKNLVQENLNGDNLERAVQVIDQRAEEFQTAVSNKPSFVDPS